MSYDIIIIGAGLYGLYAALQCAKHGERVLVLEHDDAPFQRATYINQARVHMGYHYPRSYSTAMKSAHYFERFNEDYGFCIHRDFEQIYAMSAEFSWTNAEQFQIFCQHTGIRCEELPVSRYFNEGMCDGAFLTREYTYDAAMLRDYFLRELRAFPMAELRCGVRIQSIEQTSSHFLIRLQNGEIYRSGFLLNAAYASTNQVLAKLFTREEGLQDKLAGYQPFGIKYELCEIILCEAGKSLQNIGITVMDGPFFSIMPFGKTGLHSLTAVTFTPHMTSYDTLPHFGCQEHSQETCTPEQLGNCSICPAKPKSAWTYMSHMAHKYLRPVYGFSYQKSLFSMKPILQAAEIDDSRPTVVRVLSDEPKLVSVLSGKINTVYDLDEVLQQ